MNKILSMKLMKMQSEMKNGMVGAIVGDIAGSRFEG